MHHDGRYNDHHERGSLGEQCAPVVGALARGLIFLAVLASLARIASRGATLAGGGREHHHHHGHCERCGHGRGCRCGHGASEGESGHGHCGTCGHGGSAATAKEPSEESATSSSMDDALRMLSERFARGEIDATDYTERRDLLRQ